MHRSVAAKGVHRRAGDRGAETGRQTDRTCSPIVRTAEKKPAGDGSRREMKNTFTPGQYNLGAGKMDDCASYTKGYVHVSVRSKVV